MKTTRTNRRKFLMAAGLGSAGAVAAVVARNQAPEGGDKAVAGASPQASGYRVTAHIEKYYKTTKV